MGYYGWYASVRELYAEVAKLVDALALGASAARHGGSSPLLGTTRESL